MIKLNIVNKSKIIIIDKCGMIRNLVQKDHMRAFMNRIMLMITRILKSQNSNSLILIVFMQVIGFFSMSSIMFLNDPLNPAPANYIFKIFNIMNLCRIFAFDEQIILIVLVVMASITLLLILVNFMKQPNSQAVKGLGYIVRLYQILTIPLVTYSLDNITSCIQQQNDFGTFILKIILFAITIFIIVFITAFTYFQIRPLRYNNLLWNYDNYQNYYRHIFNIGRALALYFDKLSVAFVAVSLVIQILITKMPYAYLILKINVFNQCTNYLVIVVHLTLLLSLTLANGQLCFVFLCAGSLICLIYSILHFWFLNQQEQQLPNCTFQNSAGLYNFYIHNKIKSKATKDDSVKLGSHCLVCCEENCILTELPHNNYNKIESVFLQTKITQFLKQFRYNTPQSELMYELWKIQLNKTISLSHTLRKFSLVHKFIVQYALGPQNLQLNSETTNNESSNMGLPNDSYTFKWKFYKQMSFALNQFQKLGEVMIKPLPQLNQVISVAIGIHYDTEALHKLFQEMVKMKQVNYICVELYLKFVQCFLDQKRISTEILDRLKKLKTISDIQSIQQNPLPTFLIESYTNNIQKVNAQALKFIRSQRYELKDKKFNSIIVPQYNLKQLQILQQQNKKQQFLPIFIKIKNLNNFNMMCRSIKIRSIQINNKSYYEVTVHKRNFNNNIIQILIDHNQKIVASTGEFFTLNFRQGKQERTIQSLYLQFIKPFLRQINLSKISHIQFGKNCLMNGLLIQKFCPYSSMRLLSVNLIKKMNPRNTKRMTNLRLSRLYSKAPQFGFYYHQDQSQKLILEGVQTRKLSLLQFIENPTEYNKFKQKMNTIGTETKIDGTKNYTQGIKVYRLYQNELYNVDLEDRQRYEEQFDGLKITSVSPLPKVELNQNYLLASLLIIGLIIVGGTLFLQIQTSNSLDSIRERQINLLKILQFNLNFNRILSSMRDVLNGLFTKLHVNFNPLILDSYNDIQSMDESQLFSSKQYETNYNTQFYLGTIHQLIQVCLTHVYEFTQTNNHTIILNIQNFAIKQIGKLIIAQVGSKKQNLISIYHLIAKYSLISLIVISVLCALFLTLYLLLSHKYKKNMSKFLQPLLITSDNQVRRILQQCEKFKNAITSLYKNYEVELEILGTRKQANKTRIRPKRINFGLYSIATQLIFGTLFVGVLVMLTYFHYNKSNSDTTAIAKQFDQGYAVMTSYIDLSWISNQISFTNYVNQTQLIQLQSKLTLLENNKNDLGFSTQLTKEIYGLFFNNSCAIFVEKQLITTKWCNNSLIGFINADPFRINLDLYFRKVQYNLMANITQTFASTGVYSQPFKSIFKYLSSEIQKEILIELTNTQKTLMTFSIIITAMSLCLILIVAGAYVHYKRKMKAINYGLVALSDKYSHNYYPKQDGNLIMQQDNNASMTNSNTSFQETDFPNFANQSKDVIKQY